MTTIKPSLLLFTLAVMWVLSGCTARKPVDNLREQVARHQGITHIVTTPTFNIQTVEQLSHQSRTLRIYIEGDGRAWQRKRPSIDPSPRNLVLLNLMFKDPYPDKLYMARPCQFVKNKQCSSIWWTDKRYSQDVFEAMNTALNKIKARGKWKQFELIGYSGGGTLALLLAAHRNDIVSVRTVAGNVAPYFADRLHGLEPSSEAMDPLQFTEKLQSIPQWHFVGAKDKVVPATIVQHYMASFKDQRCIRYETIEHISHAKGWLSVWPSLLQEKLPCLNK